MGQLYRRRLEYVEAVCYDPAHPPRCVEKVRRYPVRAGKKEFVSRPMVETTIGLVTVARGDWIVTYADGSRAVYPPEMFSLAFEPA